MKKSEQLSLIGDEPQVINHDDLELAQINRMMERLEMAKICIGHEQNDRAEKNLLLVRKELNKLLKRLKNRS